MGSVRTAPRPSWNLQRAEQNLETWRAQRRSWTKVTAAERHSPSQSRGPAESNLHR